MSKQLYEEALADVKRLKEVAEDNAKRALLEAVTPRIRDLIENQLMGDAEVTSDKPTGKDKLLMDTGLDECGDDEGDEDEVMAISLGGDEVEPHGYESMGDPLGGGQEYVLDASTAGKLGSLVQPHVRFESRVRKIEERIKKISSYPRLMKETKSFSNNVSSIISEIENMYDELQGKMQRAPNKKRCEESLERCYSTLKQLAEQKMTRRKLIEKKFTFDLEVPDDAEDVASALEKAQLNITPDEEGEGDEGGLEADEPEEGSENEESDEGSDDDDLFGGDEDEDGADDADEEEEDEAKMESRRLRDNLVVEIDEGMLRREISRMKMLREAEETKAQSWGHGAGEVADGFEDDDLGDPFVDVQLTTESDGEDPAMTEYGMDEDDDAKMGLDEDEMIEIVDEDDMKGVDEADDIVQVGGRHGAPGEQMNTQARQPGATVEGIRRQLAVEAKKQQVARGKAGQAKAAKKSAKTKKEAAQLDEAYAFYANQYNKSVARSNKLKGMLAEAARRGRLVNEGSTRSAAETSNLRTKLAETNLFNAKLIFTNKLLQNESLTKRQKASVIERLDEARTEREVKLVYESLTKTLANSSGRLEESASRGVIGSSSRPARPASTNLNEGFEADRWARLAGIIK